MPNNPMMLLSFVNMKLRDEYDTLDELCASFMVEKEDVIEKLASVGYEYNEANRCFSAM